MTGINEIMAEAERLKEEIIRLCHPFRIILFGSVASGVVHKGSDIDLCIVADYEDKRALLTELYTKLETDIGIDIVLYRPEDWERNCGDTASFAYLIKTKGRLLYGGF